MNGACLTRNRSFCFVYRAENRYKADDAGHFKQDFDTVGHIGDRELALGALTGGICPNERAKARRIHVGNGANVDNDGMLMVETRSLLEIEESTQR